MIVDGHPKILVLPVVPSTYSGTPLSLRYYIYGTATNDLPQQWWTDINDVKLN